MKNLFPLFFSVLVFISCTDSSKKVESSFENNNTKCDSIKYLHDTNKEVVLNFYQQMFGDKDISAVDRYISAKEYIQHNPTVPDGAEAFKEAAKGWFEGAPKTKVDIQRIAAEGDLVFIHIKNVNPDGSLTSTIDIFRLENGKIVEHWDVHQEVPRNAANNHPMF